MKKLLSVLMITIMLFSTMAISVSADNGEISVYLDNAKIEFDVQPQIINGRTLVPMRKIFEELGAVVDWDNSTQTAMGTRGNTVVKFTINDYTMYKNESAKTLDVPAQLINGRTLIPLRAVSEAFDCQVGWDGSTSTISIINDFENYTMLYALGDRSKSFPIDSISEQLTVGWYTEPVQMLYAPDKSAVFKKSEVPAQLTVGWSEEPFVTLYALDGRKTEVVESEVSSYLNVGWYRTLAETQQTMYAPDGRTITVYKSEVSTYKNVGWYETKSEALAANKQKNNSSTTNNPSADGNYYRTPTGKRYHLDPNCGGKNSYKTTNISGLSPCSKCAK